VSISPTTTPTPVDSFQAAGMSIIVSAAGISRKSLPCNTPVCTQPAIWCIG
jgi:hypothetical protein